MEYNTSREKLLIPEYGRNVQQMVKYAIGIEDRERRTRLAHLIVNVMAQLHPTNKDIADYKQKLWDHLFIISDFKLDVDSPYPKPSKEVLDSSPDKLKYHSNGIRYRHYGKNIEFIIDHLAGMEDGQLKHEMTKILANHLKKTYLTWNRDSVNDEVIKKHLIELSDGRLDVPDDFSFDKTNDILSRQTKKKKKGQRQQQNNPRFNKRQKRN